MSEIKDGGPAFPRSSFGPADDFDMAEGMSLRDWFAGKALQGELSCPMPAWRKDIPPENLAEYCYKLADAMLAEREKRARPMSGKGE